mmetsp:Transcript_126992/g.317293  ORF Transcript_126992/g.317293 Transcript_126992/m.317293 type:complete len:130 (-) Transcript_126992:98-487(-)
MEDLNATPIAQLSDIDQFMIMLNLCAAVCSSLVYCLLNLRQKQTAGQREKYFPGPFMPLAEASQSWRVYRQCSNKAERDTHVCNFCGFAIKASPTDLHGPTQELLSEDTRNEANKGLKRRVAGKKGKKA